MQTNPLVNYRAPNTPETRNHPFRDGNHFRFSRENAVMSNSMVTVFPGEFRYAADPTLEIDLAFWEDRPDMNSKGEYLTMTIQKGYQVAMASEFEVCDDRLKIAWQADAAGRLTFGGMSTNTMVLMWRTGEAADRDLKSRTKLSDEVQQSAEEREAALSDKLAPLNASVSMSIVDDDGTDNPTPINKKSRR